MPEAATSPTPARHRLYAAVVLLVVAVAYLPSFHGGWVWDDHYHNETNPQLAEPVRVLTQTCWEGEDLGYGDNYRPVTLLTHAAVHQLDLGPPGERAISYGLHLAAVLLVAGIALRLGASASVAWLAALLFGVHTGASEAAIWTNARSDLLISVLVLAAWWSWLGKKDLAAGLILGLAIWCKESSLVMPGVVALLMWGHRRWSWRLVIPAIGSMAVYLTTRQLLDIQIHFGAAGADPLASYGAVTLRAAQLILAPWTADALPAYHAIPILGGLVLLAGAAGCWFGRGRPLLAGFCATSLVLVPNAAASAHNQVLGDRYFHLTLAAGAVGLAVLLAKRSIPRTAWLLAAPLAVLTFVRAHAWIDDHSLFTASLDRDPGNALAAYHVAFDHHTRDGDCEAALPLYQQAAPVERRAANGVQACLLDLGRYNEAAEIGPGLAEADPANSTPASNTARALAQLFRLADAERWAREAITRRPQRVANHVLLGQILGMQGRFEEAEAAFLEALRLDPENTEAQQGADLARTKAAEGDDPEASAPSLQ